MLFSGDLALPVEIENLGCISEISVIPAWGSLVFSNPAQRLGDIAQTRGGGAGQGARPFSSPARPCAAIWSPTVSPRPLPLLPITTPSRFYVPGPGQKRPAPLYLHSSFPGGAQLGQRPSAGEKEASGGGRLGQALGLAVKIPTSLPKVPGFNTCYLALLLSLLPC